MIKSRHQRHHFYRYSHIVSILGLISMCTIGCAELDNLDRAQAGEQKNGSYVSGETCDVGCIWSTFAVTSGLQTADAQCDNGPCACVKDGQATISCEPTNLEINTVNNETDAVLPKSSSLSCQNGCIWSTYAVSEGLQSAMALCDGVQCACVVDGDANRLCSDSDQAPESSPIDSESTSSTSNLPTVPYFNQYSNRLHPSASCQNTSVAMVLGYLGWNGQPDDITRQYGKDWAQSPDGLAALFNTYVSRHNLSMRLTPNTSGTISSLRSALDRGHPVIIHGYFTSYGHVLVVLGYDEGGYFVHDPAGRWSQRFKGGYSGGSGESVYYQKVAFEAAVATSDGYSALPLWFHTLD